MKNGPNSNIMKMHLTHINTLIKSPNETRIMSANLFPTYLTPIEF